MSLRGFFVFSLFIVGWGWGLSTIFQSHWDDDFGLFLHILWHYVWSQGVLDRHLHTQFDNQGKCPPLSFHISSMSWKGFRLSIVHRPDFIFGPRESDVLRTRIGHTIVPGGRWDYESLVRTQVSLLRILNWNLSTYSLHRKNPVRSLSEDLKWYLRGRG